MDFSAAKDCTLKCTHRTFSDGIKKWPNKMDPSRELDNETKRIEKYLTVVLLPCQLKGKTFVFVLKWFFCVLITQKLQGWPNKVSHTVRYIFKTVTGRVCVEL